MLFLGFLELNSLSSIPRSLKKYKNKLRLDPMVIFGEANDLAFTYDEEFNLKHKLFCSTIKGFIEDRKRASDCQQFGKSEGNYFTGIRQLAVYGHSRLASWFKRQDVVIVTRTKRDEYCLNLYKDNVPKGGFFEKVTRFMESLVPER